MATLNIRLDDQLKKDAFEVLDELAISPSEFVRAVFRYVADERRLPVKLLSFDQDNYEATVSLWGEYGKFRLVTLEVIDQLKLNKTIVQERLNEIFALLDRFTACSTERIAQLTRAQEWSLLTSRLQQFAYNLKSQSLASRQGSEFVMYSSEAIKVFGQEFFEIDRDAHELMLHSRYL